MNVKKAGGTVLVLLLFTVSTVPALAVQATVSHAYSSNAAIPAGSLVSLSVGKKGFVQPANISNATSLVGVVVGNNDSVLAINPGSYNSVQVVTSGTADVLASTINGAIKPGDQIAASAFNGIGVRARSGDKIIGLAQTSLTDASTPVTHQTVTDKKGNKHQVSIGYARVSIAVGIAASKNSAVSNFLGKLAQGIAGHPVSLARVYLSAAIGILAALAIITLVYASIFGGIIAIGRNPLAKTAIMRSVTSVFVMVLALTAIALVSISFFLR